MNNANKIQNADNEIALTTLAESLRNREREIDEQVKSGVKLVIDAAWLSFDQGDELLKAKSLCGHGRFEKWLADNFPKSKTTAERYLKLAQIPKASRMTFLADGKTITGVYRLLGVLPPEPENNKTSLPSISIPQEVQKLNWIAEWVGRDADKIESWEPARREELKTKLRPVVEIFNKL